MNGVVAAFYCLHPHTLMVNKKVQNKTKKHTSRKHPKLKKMYVV